MVNTISLSGTPPKPRLSLWANPYQILRRDWLSRAASLPGKSLAVALALLLLVTAIAVLLLVRGWRPAVGARRETHC